VASAMRKVSLRGLAAHKVRFSLTVLSVVLGTAFIAASFVFTQMLGRSFDDIVELSTDGVAVQVQPTEELGAGVPLALVDTVRAVDGVRAVEPSTSGAVTLIGADGTAVGSGGAPSVGFAWVTGDDAVSDSGRLTDGRAPEGPDEIVVNASAAEKAGLTVGDSTRVIPQSGSPLEVEVVGIHDSDVAGLGGFIGIGFSPDAAVDLFTDGVNASDLLVAADDGVDEQVLTRRVLDVLPEGATARPGSELREESATEFQTALSFINGILFAFGFIALLVGSFLIANTFSMVVAQRSREMALLRAVGASRGQVTRSVALEALLVGLFGSAIGLAAGFGLSKVLSSVLSAVGSGIPVSGQRLSLTTVLITMGCGTVITLLAAVVPARRAGAIAPVEAMRGVFASPSRNHTLRLVLSALALTLGVFATWVGVATTDQIWIGAGFLGVGATVVLMSPLLAPAVFSVIGPLLARPFGSIGRMARGNAARNPRRTAATGLALAIGLALVTVVAIVGASAKASLTQIASSGMRWDFVVGGPQGQPVPEGVLDALATVPDVETIVAVRAAPAVVGGEAAFGFGMSGDVGAAVDLDLVEGEATVSDSTILVNQDTAGENGWGVGDDVVLGVPGVAEVPLRVAGVYDSEYFTGWIVSAATADALVPAPQRAVFQVFVVGSDGVDQAQLQDDLREAVAPYVTTTVDDLEAFTAALTSQVDILLGILYGLLALAVVISILGIVNTLGLSVVERRREIGMLRAVGMLRSQVRKVIYVESVLISVYGALLGLVVGLVFGYLFARSLVPDGLDITVVPWGQVALFLVVAAVVGVLSALWPGHRAARTRPLEAIAAE
jgi:putative ABC transport system permease protein